MKARLNCALGFLTFGLLATTSICTPFSEAQAAAAEAKTGWTVNRVASAAAGSYCTMTQKYSDSSILTFAQNQAGEYSLAFDFAQSYFPDAKATTVSLRPAGGSAQTFNVKPTSDKVVVVGIGKDQTFVNSLKASGKFDFEAAGKTHTYKAAKFDVAANELSKCVSSMQSTSSVADNGDSSKVIAQAPASLSGEEASLIDLKSENAQLKDALAQARKSYEMAQTGSQPAVASELQEKISLLQKENDELKARKSGVEQVAQTADAKLKVSDAVTQRLSEMEKQNAELKTQLSSANQAIAQMQVKAVSGSDATAQLASLQKANEDLKAQLASKEAAANSNSSVATKLTQLEKDNADLKSQLTLANQTVGQLQAKTVASNDKASNDKQIEELKKELAATRQLADLNGAKALTGAATTAQIAELQKANADLQSKLALRPVLPTPDVGIEKTVAQLRDENADLKEQLADAMTKSSKSTASSTMLAASDSEIKSLRNQLELAQTQNESLKKQMAALDSVVATNQSKVAGGSSDAQQAEQRYQESQREIRRLTMMIDEQQVKFNQDKKNIEAKLFDPAIASKEQIAKLDELQSQIAQLEQKAKNSVPSEADKVKIAELQSKLATAEASEKQLKQLQDQLKTAQADQAKIAELQNQLKVAQGAQSKVEELQKQLASAQTDKVKMEELQRQLAVAQSAQGKILELQNQLTAAQADKTKVAELQAQLAAAQADKAKVADLQAQLIQAQSAQGKILELQNQLAAAQADKTKVAELQAQLASAQADKAKVADLQAQLIQAQSAQGKILELQNQLAAAQADKAKISQLEKQVQDTQATQAKISQLEQQVQQSQAAQTKMAQLEQQVAMARATQAKVDELERKMQATQVAATAPAAGMDTMASAPVPIAAAEPTPIVRAPSAPVTIAPVASAIVTPPSSVKFQSREDFARMLSHANVNTQGPVEIIAGGNTDMYRAYRWKTENLYGSAEQKPVRSPQAFETYVKAYLDRAKTRCGGDFAAEPADAPASGFESAKAYEIACIGGKTDTSASVLFTYGNNVMTTIAHEGKSAAMNSAMEARDRLGTELGNSQSASR